MSFAQNVGNKKILNFEKLFYFMCHTIRVSPFNATC